MPLPFGPFVRSSSLQGVVPRLVGPSLEAGVLADDGQMVEILHDVVEISHRDDDSAELARVLRTP